MGALVTNVKITADGELVLPPEVRKAIGLEGEARLTAKVENGEVRLIPTEARVARAQALYRKYAKRGRSTDEFLATRERD